MLRRPPVKEIVFQKQSRRESRSSPCSGQTGPYRLWPRTEKYIYIYIFLLYDSDSVRIFQGRRDSRRRASASRCPSSKRSPLKTAPLIQPPFSPFIWLHHLQKAQEMSRRMPPKHKKAPSVQTGINHFRRQLLQIQKIKIRNEEKKNHLRSKFPAKEMATMGIPAETQRRIWRIARRGWDTKKKKKKKKKKKQIKAKRIWYGKLDRSGPTGRCRESLPWQPVGLGCSSPTVRQRSAEATAAAAAAHRARKREHWMWRRRRRRRGNEGGEEERDTTAWWKGCIGFMRGRLISGLTASGWFTEL